VVERTRKGSVLETISYRQPKRTIAMKRGVAFERGKKGKKVKARGVENWQRA